MNTKKGLFFVVDGTDGSGKATQTKLLIGRLIERGLPTETVSFPRYGKKSAGPTEEYLARAYGDPTKLDAKIASTFYAVDRYAASFDIRAWLQAGRHVVADRWVSSNMGHQGGKISDPGARLAFLKWNDELEYGLFGLPQPDVSIILHVPAEIGQELANKRDGHADGHQDSLQHLRDAEATYLEMARLFPERFKLVECTRDGKLLPPDEIHKLVWQIIEPLLDR